MEENIQTCGLRKAKIVYISKSEVKNNVFSIINGDTQVQAKYLKTNGYLLGTYQVRVNVTLADWPDNKGTLFRFDVNVDCPAKHT